MTISRFWLHLLSKQNATKMISISSMKCVCTSKHRTGSIPVKRLYIYTRECVCSDFLYFPMFITIFCICVYLVRTLMSNKYIINTQRLLSLTKASKKSSLLKWDSSLFKWKVTTFSKGKWLRNSENALTTFINPLLQKIKPCFTSFVSRNLNDSIFFKWMKY